MIRRVSAATDVGRKRPHNEDSHVCLHEEGIYIVCDGMGGHAAGEIASKTAADAAQQFIQERIVEIRTLLKGAPEDRRRASMLVAASGHAANSAVHELGTQRAEYRGMGTTFTALVISEDRALVAHVGDSRLYLQRGSDVNVVTTDHTIVTDLIRAGRAKPEDEHKLAHLNALTRAVGVYPTVEVESLELDVLPGDVFLLCSDGLHGYLPGFDLGTFLSHSNAESAAGDLITFANKKGGHDNITAIVVYVARSAETEQSLRIRLTLDTLRDIPMFQYLSFSELLRVITVCRPVFMAKGDVIIREGDAANDFYIILGGAASITRGDLEITQVKRGQYFGEMSLIDNRPRSATVTANDAMQLIRISREDFYDILRQDSVMAVKLLWNIIQTLSSVVRSRNAELDRAMHTAAIELHPYAAANAINAALVTGAYDAAKAAAAKE